MRNSPIVKKEMMQENCYLKLCEIISRAQPAPRSEGKKSSCFGRIILEVKERYYSLESVLTLVGY